MPIHKCKLADGSQGWQWGESGKKYKNKEDAEKQMRAIFANGYILKHAALTLPLLKELSDNYYTDDRKQHIQEVLANARNIKGKLLTPILLAAIYMHDSAKRDMGATGHLLNSAKLVALLLKDKYTKPLLKKIVTAIKLHGPAWLKNDPDLLYSQPLSLLLGIADDWNIMDNGPSTLANKVLKYNVPRHPLWDLNLFLKQILLKSNMDTRLPKLKIYDKQWQLHVAPIRLYNKTLTAEKVKQLMSKYIV